MDAAERWFKKMDYDKEAARQDKAAKDALDAAWYKKDVADGERFTLLTAALKDCWLHDGFPLELQGKLDEWKGQEKSLKLDKKALKAYATYAVPWKKGWADGLAVYQKPLASWKVPK